MSSGSRCGDKSFLLMYDIFLYILSCLVMQKLVAVLLIILAVLVVADV